MLIAIDSIKDAKKLIGQDIVYVFDDEPLDKLLKTKLHCIHYSEVRKVDINLTKYNIKCRKRAKITDKDLFELPPIKENKYAIIIPNYNNAHGEYQGKTYLENCIESILNQTYKNFEIIFVDDRSTDNSVDVVKHYKDSRIHIIENKRKRYNGGSRNVGIDYALDNLDFDYFCFLDSDDWWKHNQVLETINEEIGESEMLLLGLECIDENGVFLTKLHEYNNYEDFFLSDNKVWCTAWARVIRKDKIVYFCEDTLMEDRVWSYRQADNVDLDKVVNLKEVMYVWNRLNRSNSVSLKRDDYWNASAWCHIGHQLQLISQLKHKEMIPVLEKRVKECIRKCNNGTYQQY